MTCRNMYSEWTAELKAMTDRLTGVRQQLFDALERKGNTMFCYQVDNYQAILQLVMSLNELKSVYFC